MDEDPVNSKHGLAESPLGVEDHVLPTGRVVSTPSALRLMQIHNIDPFALLRRHCTGDWGDMDLEDLKANVKAIEFGLRVFSAYNISANDRVWLITEADRSATTFLLPSEY